MKNLLIITQRVDENDQLLGFFIDWLKRFSEKFRKITVLCLERGKCDLPENIEVISMGKDSGYSKIRQLSTFYFLLSTLKYDVIFVHMNPIWVVLGGPVWRLSGKKIFFWYTSGGVTAKLKLAEKFADVIFTASKESFRLSSKKVIITGHGIDTGLFKPDSSRSKAIPAEVPRHEPSPSNLKDGASRFDLKGIKILSVGRLAPVKNYETLIDATKILKDTGLDFSVTMIGEVALDSDHRYLASLKLKVKNLKLEENFKFIGKVNHKELPEYYQSHDIFVHLSKTGSVDKTLLEAMASGMKVLSSNDSARAFLPAELLFNGFDPAELAAKIVAVKDEPADPALREYVVRNHNLDKLIENISFIIGGPNLTRSDLFGDSRSDLKTSMRVLYFGIYEPSYARNWVLINGLKKNGVDVLELRQKSGRFALCKLFFSYLRFKQNYDVMIVGFPGQEVMFLAKLLALFRLGSGQVKPLIFDAFTSHYGGYILDRKKWARDSLRAKYFKFLDKWSCKLADIVLLDTNAHIEFFVREFKLPKEKFRKIWIGANDDNFRPMDTGKREDGLFKVLFFGSYVPLQGSEYIVRAAKTLEGQKDIVFYFIGKGQDKPTSMRLAEELELKNITFIDMMKPEDLRAEIAGSDVVLGLFGDTPKTPLVIPNKVYEALAMQKPVITADTAAIRELFNSDDMYLVPPAKPEEIARAVIVLKNDPGLRMRLAESGHKKFIERASSKVLGGELVKILNEIKKT